MKWTNLAIVFFLLELSLFIILDVRMNNVSAVVNKKIEYSKALDSAVDDGVINLVEVDNKRNLILKKENAVDQFYQSLYANFGVIGNSAIESKLKGYIPIILVTDTDGFYIYYSDIYEINNEVLVVQRWSEKYPYVYEQDNLIFNFTLGNYLTVYDKSTNSLYKGEYKDLVEVFPDSILANFDTFDSLRRNTIISRIEESMNYYINNHNLIAKQFGITYNFWLPQIDKTDWYRTIDDISMLVVFQGYPYNVANLDTFNRYTIGGARIRRSNTFYITEENGRKYYHRFSCSHVNITGQQYYTKEECALEGAYPCIDCKP